MAGLAPHMKRTLERPHALRHAGQTQSLSRLGILRLVKPTPVVMDTYSQPIPGAQQPHKDVGGLGVFLHVLQTFLQAPIETGRLRERDRHRHLSDHDLCRQSSSCGKTLPRIHEWPLQELAFRGNHHLPLGENLPRRLSTA